jgi:hypothetical protein
VTALSAGCQVISAGYPLYEALGDLIYRDIDSFLNDLNRGEMKHSAREIGQYEAAIDAIASAAQEAAGLTDFLGQLKPSPAVENLPIALIHGQATSGAAHKMVRALHGLSVGSPYCAAELGFDVMFRTSGARLVMLISDLSAKRASPAIRQTLLPARSISDRKFWIVPETGEDVAGNELERAQWHGAALPFQLATYQSTMARIAERLDKAFGPSQVLISESSPVPFSVNL